MRLRGILAELRHRGVLKVATVYLASGVVVLEAGSHLLHNFEAPHWVVKVFTALVIFGFPIACLMAWGFEFKDGSVHPAPPINPDAPAKPGRADAFLAGLLLLVLGLLAVLVVQQWRRPAAEVTQAAAITTASQRGRQATTHIAMGPPSIAVLPFADMSAEHDQQYLGDGIAEELLNALASIEGLNVAARTSSFSFAGKGVSMKEIGDTLHVRHVLEGSVRRSGQKLRVTAQLIDVESGFHLFSQSYDREVKDIFEIQNEIAREIVGALLPKLGLKKDANLVKQGTTNLEAYNLRLKAHQSLTSLSYDTARAGIAQLKQAIALDPSFGDAWGDLAYTYAYMALWAGDPAPLMVKASSAAAVALVHSPNNVPALLTQGIENNLMDHDMVAAAKAYEQARAIGTDPSVWAVNKALFFDAPKGRYDEAIATLREAELKDPLGVTLKYALVVINVGAGRIDEAVAASIPLGKLGSKSPGALAFPGWAYLKAGDVERAREYLLQLHDVYGTDNWNAVLLRFGIDESTGNRGDARALLDRQLARYEEGQYVSAYVIGEGYKALGAYDEAISWFTRAVEQHHPHAVAMMPLFNRNHPVIGKDARFLALLKRMGLEGGPAVRLPD